MQCRREGSPATVLEQADWGLDRTRRYLPESICDPGQRGET
jgi:hypothetical protein